MTRPRFLTAYVGPELLVIDVPGDVDFSDLHLTRRHSDDKLFFDWQVVMRVCIESRIDFVRLRNSESTARRLVIAWYKAHRELGGKPDPVAEELIAEADIVHAHGGGFFYPPGRA
jgi:hypothetical protein